MEVSFGNEINFDGRVIVGVVDGMSFDFSDSYVG